MKSAPYGSWRSPITTELLTAETVTLLEPRIDNDHIYWLETRPWEEGRNVLVRYQPDGTIQEVSPQPWHLKTRVHEYGGGSYFVSQGQVFFSHFYDQQLYQLQDQNHPIQITNHPTYRFAEPVYDPINHQLICIAEDHATHPQHPINQLVTIDLEHQTIHPLQSENDFYSSPKLSPDGNQLAWLTWNHPSMPWDGTELWVAERASDGSWTNAKWVAGGQDESIFQPEWSEQGELYFVSDRTGWWNLYRWHQNRIHPVFEMQAEFGLASFFLGQSTYAFVARDQLLATYCKQGIWQLVLINTQTGSAQEISTPFTFISSIQAENGKAVFLAGSSTEALAVVQFDLATREYQVLKKSFAKQINKDYISIPEPIAFPTHDQQTSYAFYYPPTNPDFQGLDQELPPLLVISHGGPTFASFANFRLEIQYWTSRGFAVLDVNYGGSIGYGRAYRNRLKGKWGIVDVDDCIAGAKYLIKQGLVDAKRTAIRGWSAGGYTTLAALTFRDFFQAGASYYGVSDLELLAKHTHKFESHYLDSLIGPYPASKSLYYQRSPIHHTSRLSKPMIFFQGLLDRVVPPDQANKMVEALQQQQIPVAYLTFADEAHGFTKAKNIRAAFEAELYFYAKIFDFPLHESIEPIHIENFQP